jgi:AAA domain-containing protein
MSQRIRRFADIPDVLTMDIPPMEHIVRALGIARNTLTLWTGADGDGKTFMAQAMAVAVASGSEFLGMPCEKTPVLYVDLENPAYMLKSRLELLAASGGSADLRFWGIWCEEQPPTFGNPTLLDISREIRPLIIIDPFRYFHEKKENDSTEMAPVMQFLRACARHGSAVVLLHHPAKTEGSTGRGSSAIRGACDLALLHSLDKDGEMITLKVDKNRHGERRTITIRANFEDGKFEVAESAYITRRNEELAKIEAIMRANPGITTNSIAEESRIAKGRLKRLLEEGCGKRWLWEPGPNKSHKHYVITCGYLVPEPLRTTETTQKSGGAVVPVVRRPLGGTTVPPAERTLPQCPECQSFYVSREGSCESCGYRPMAVN